MKKIWMFLWVALSAPTCLLGTLLEVDRFEEIVPFVDGSTLVLIDLDNTLYESELMLGSAPWRSYFRKKMQSLAIPEENQKRLMDSYWDFLQQIIPIHAVDPEGPAIVNQLREQGILVFGFTARAKREMGHTTRQLQEIGVNFTPFSAPLFDQTENDAAFENGVIYSGDLAKSEALMALLNYLQLFDSCCAPETLLVLDDHEHNILTLEPVATSFSLKYVGVRFTGADQRGELFNPEVVEYQWRHLPVLISDTEAEEKVSGTLP